MRDTSLVLTSAQLRTQDIYTFPDRVDASKPTEFTATGGGTASVLVAGQEYTAKTYLANGSDGGKLPTIAQASVTATIIGASPVPFCPRLIRPTAVGCGMDLTPRPPVPVFRV